jgi:TPR repeat protein
MGMAFSYLAGEGCEQNVKAAFHCFQKLSTNPSAMFECGISYELGRGVTVDLVEAHKYYIVALEHAKRLKSGFINAYLFAIARLKLLQPEPDNQDEALAFRIMSPLSKVLSISF